MGDKVTSNFLTCKVDANLTQDEQRKVVQSVELTKALVLMGYMKWSELEPASMRDKEGYVAEKLQERMEEKLNGMWEFKESADFARTLNATLQEKMLEANEERAAALFTKKKVEEMVEDLDLGAPKKPLGLMDQMDEKMINEEKAQMEKAIKVLMGEYENRKKIRDKAKAAGGKVTKRVAAMMIFNQKKDTFSKIKNSQIEEIQKYQKQKEEYHKQQEELEKKRAKEDELAKEKEAEERKKRESQSGLSFGRGQLDSTASDDGDIFGGNRDRRNNDYFDEEDDIFGGPQRHDSVKGGPRNRGSQNSTSDDKGGLGRKDSTKEEKKKKSIYQERGPDMSRQAKVIGGVFCWDRQQNQKNNSTFSGRSKGRLDTGQNVKKKKPVNDYDDFNSGSKPTKRAVSPMLGRRESPGMGKKGGGKSPSSGRNGKEKNGLLALPGDSDSDDDISLLGSGTSNHSIVRSRSANTSLGTVVAVNSAFRRRKGI